MEINKNKHIGLKFIYSVLSFTWGMIVPLLLLWTGLFIYSTFFSKELLPVMWGLSARLNLQTLGVAKKLTDNIWLSSTDSSIIVFNPSFGLSLYSYLYFIIVVSAIGYVVLMTRRIISSVLEGSPFIKTNSLRLRVIGLILIIVPVFLQVFSYIMLNSINILNTNRITSFSSSYGSYTFAGFVFGLLFLVIDEVFRVGVAMKEEQDLTV